MGGFCSTIKILPESVIRTECGRYAFEKKYIQRIEANSYDIHGKSNTKTHYRLIITFSYSTGGVRITTLEYGSDFERLKKDYDKLTSSFWKKDEVLKLNFVNGGIE